MALQRRILSLWFPRLAAERALRRQQRAMPGPLVIVAEIGNTQILSSVTAEAEAAGLRVGQSLRDARSLCPTLVAHPADPLAEASHLASLRHWAGKFSPWVSEERPTSLLIDVTGCANLFGGEAALMAQAGEDCAGFGLTVQMGTADTPGLAWALARFAGQPGDPGRSGDAIAQEARATRSRAAKRRHWERGGAAPQMILSGSPQGRIAPPGHVRQVLAPLPMIALRLPQETVETLARLGLRRVEDVMGIPRAVLARRFGTLLMRRLDQALGQESEPITPARPPYAFAVRLAFPEPIGLREDILAGIDRLLPTLTAKLTAKGKGARRIRLLAYCSDHRVETIEVGLARPLADPDRLRPLLAMKVEEIDPGFGIDMLRLEAHVTEPVQARQHRGHFDAAASASGRAKSDTAMEDLIARLGARLGLEAITRVHPANSHIPEKAFLTLAAAWSEPAQNWPAAPTPRPLLLHRPEFVVAPDISDPPRTLRWRRRALNVIAARGPERFLPEWWLDDPDWRSGPRDYWRVEVDSGERLWLFHACGAEVSGGWFCHGAFA
jgi:protein ImuB